jgi:hypothetical protein
MKQMFLIIFLLGAVGFPQSEANAYRSESFEECYQITSFETIEEAVREYKKITDKLKLTPHESPVLLPTKLPFGVVLSSVQLVACGHQLDVDYVYEKHSVRFKVNPIYKPDGGLKGNKIISLNDGTKAVYRDFELGYLLYFQIQGRAYMVVIDKIKRYKYDEYQAMDDLIRIAQSVKPLN